MLGIKHALNTGEYSNISAATVGKAITAVTLEDNVLVLRLEGGQELVFSDNQQNCCESRWMSTDDNLEEYVGAQFVGAELKGHSSLPGGEAHDIEFFEVQTTKGCFTMVNHNEHNGYYGGFGLEVTLR